MSALGTAFIALIVSASPPGLELRPERAGLEAGDSITLLLKAPPDVQRPTIASTVGIVSAVVPAGAPGSFRATLKVQENVASQVALITATARQGKTWLTAQTQVAVSAPTLLKHLAPPRSQVSFEIAGRTFGPFTPNGAGEVKARVVVPPFTPTGRVTVKERSGQRFEQELPLPPGRSRRLRAAILADRPQASFAAPVEIAVFTLDSEGRTPDRLPALQATADKGRFGEWRVGADRIPRILYYGANRAGERAQVKVALAEDPSQSDTLLLESVAGPPARIEVDTVPDAVVAGARTPVRLNARVVDAQGNVAASADGVKFSSDVGGVEAQGPLSAQLLAPDAFGARAYVVVTAVAGNLIGQGQVTLRADRAVAARVLSVQRQVRAGAPAVMEVAVADRFDNPVRGARLVARGAGGASLGPVSETAPGVYRVEYVVGQGATPGQLPLELGVEGADAVARAEVDVLPPQPAWAATVGVVALGQTNFAFSTGIGGRLDAGLRLGGLPLELVLHGEGRMNQLVSRALEGGTEEQTVYGGSARLGLRYTLPLVSRWALHASASAGAQYIGGKVAIDAYGVQREVDSIGPAIAGGLGASFALGAGRFLLDVQWVHAPGTGAVRGNFGGLGAGVGYVLELGGRR